MNVEREHSAQPAARTDRADHDADIPGRSSATERLVGGHGPIPSGLISRKAERDDNNVAADAHHHVDKAAGGGGAALPSELRSQFESALGHDLGGVRVHTGADSAAAADAVGARAYATGNDIHFNHGEYDPHSTDGQLLLAHEVVHTVQQQGSAPTTQYKLEVSSASDAHEIEADNLAAQMVAPRGAATATPAISAAPSAVARKAVTPVGRGIHRWDSRKRWGFPRPGDSTGWTKDNPADPWNHGPNDYIAVGSAMSGSAPAELSPITPMWAGKWPEPLNGVKSDGKPGELPPSSTVDKANDAIDALHAAVGGVVDMHNSIPGKVADYRTAADGVGQTGLFGPAPDGLNWAPPANGAKASDPGDLANKQMPTGDKGKNGTNTPLGQVFGQDNKVTGVSDKTVAAAKQFDVSALLETARAADNTVAEKVKDYRSHIKLDIGKAVRGVQNAFTNLKKKEESDKADKAEEKKADLEKEKTEAKEVIETCGKVIESGSKVLEGDVTAARELILIAADKVVSHHFDKEIKAQTQIIRGAKAKIRSLDQVLVTNAIQDALDDLDKAVAALEAKRVEVVKALKARQDAYDKAAEEAKKQAIAHGADPKEADRLQAAIAAIPRIEIVVTKLRALVDGIAMPGYDPVAGLAYAVGRNGNQGIDAPAFERAIGGIKGQHDKYAAEQGKWQARLDSTRALALGLNVPTAKAK